MSENSDTFPPNTKGKNSERFTNSSIGISDPFINANVNSYSFKPKIIPPYVLDTISAAHYKDQLNNSNVNASETSVPVIKSAITKQTEEEQFLSYSNDMFVKSMNNDWTKLLKTVQQPTIYTQDLRRYDRDFTSEWKLDGSWGGDDRLKSALLGSPSSDEITYVGDEKRGFLSGIFRSKNKVKTKDFDSPRVRSKAGYWMSDEKRADLLPTLKRIFVQNPLVPLFLRILTFIVSACALGLACTIFVYSRRKYDGIPIQQQSSTIMAVVVQCFAIVYVIYIAYDEYSGKPLGLRDPLGKLKLIMLDLLFIIFSSANLSLTFNTLYDDEWVCTNDFSPGLSDLYPPVASICRRQRSLAAFLFITLCLWLLTFTISMVRVVDRVNVANTRKD